MATLYSNELKAVVVPENFLDNPRNVLKENCLTVQQFNYDCVMKRNDSGEIYGVTNPVVLEFSVRVNSPHHAKPFFKELVSTENTYFSFLFNVTYDTNQRIANYEDGMVVDGYVVNLEEVYGSETVDNMNGSSQMLLRVKILTRSVTYLGREMNDSLKSIFIQ